VCDGVGTHLGYSVVKKAVDLRMEILVRVPYPIFMVQGEDTTNFKVSLCPPDDFVAVVVDDDVVDDVATNVDDVVDVDAVIANVIAEIVVDDVTTVGDDVAADYHVDVDADDRAKC
jgi:hypothetical protein